MNTEELRQHLLYLTGKYVEANSAQLEIRELIQREDVPVKGILVLIDKEKTKNFSEEDGNLVHNIVYYYV